MTLRFVARLIGAAVLFMGCGGVASGQTITTVPDIASLQALGSTSPTVAHAFVQEYTAGTNRGGGNFDWIGGACTPDGGVWFDAPPVPSSTGCWHRNFAGWVMLSFFGPACNATFTPTVGGVYTDGTWGGTDDTAKLQAWLTYASARDLGFDMQNGACREAGGLVIPRVRSVHIHGLGQPGDVTYNDPPGAVAPLTFAIVTNDTSGAILSIGTTGVNNVNAIEVDHLELLGSSYTTGALNVFVIPFQAGKAAAQVHLHDLKFALVAGRGIYDQLGAYSSAYERIEGSCANSLNVSASQWGGCMDIATGVNSVAIRDSFMHYVGDHGIAFRCHSACVLDSDTGIDRPTAMTDYWGVFGDTVAEDGVLSYCGVSITNSDIEDSSNGIYAKTCGPNFYNSVCQAPSSGTGLECLSIGSSANVNRWGSIDEIDSLLITKGGTFANSRAVHVDGNVPFNFIGNRSGPTVAFYDDNAGADVTVASQGYILASGAAGPPFPYQIYGRSALASAPTCNAGLWGQFWNVTDGAASPVYGAATVGGGGLRQLSFCDGVSWKNH